MYRDTSCILKHSYKSLTLYSIILSHTQLHKLYTATQGYTRLYPFVTSKESHIVEPALPAGHFATTKRSYSARCESLVRTTNRPAFMRLLAQFLPDIQTCSPAVVQLAALGASFRQRALCVMLFVFDYVLFRLRFSTTSFPRSSYLCHTSSFRCKI